ncbi:unnamed protein product [Linum trigynum]|uniref:Uncharacterized protein n=1 Tax=Linum trigynum TaxID=586398 RepID=A0AAV2F9U7_9ROSI
MKSAPYRLVTAIEGEVVFLYPNLEESLAPPLASDGFTISTTNIDDFMAISLKGEMYFYRKKKRKKRQEPVVVTEPAIKLWPPQVRALAYSMEAEDEDFVLGFP